MSEQHYGSGRPDSPGPLPPAWHGVPRAVPPPLGRPEPVPGANPHQYGATSAFAAPSGTAQPAWVYPAGPFSGQTGQVPLPGPILAPVPVPTPKTGLLRGRRKLWLAGVGVLVVALAAGLASLSGSGQQPASPPADWSPFYSAALDLAAEPMVHFAGSVPGAGESWDVDVSSGGEQLGTVTAAGQQISVLTVGGVTYVKPPPGMLSDLPSGQSASALQGKWITGDDSLAGLVPQGLASPMNLGTELWTELTGASDFPAVGAAPVSVDGTAAVKVSLPAGVLYVTAQAPYRVLRLAPASSAGSSSTASPGSKSSALSAFPALSELSTLSARVDQGPRIEDASADPAQTDTGQTDIEPMSPDAIDQAYNDLVSQTQSLNSAVDVGVSFDFNQTGNLSCSQTDCTVTEDVSTSTSSSQAAVLSGNVTAVMTATVTVNGDAGGGCEQTATLPINGDGTMTCDDPGVAPAVQAIANQAQQEADEQAAATGQDAEVPYTLDYEADVEIEAMADVQAQVDQEVQAEQTEQNAADQDEQQGPACSLSSFVPSGPGAHSSPATALSTDRVDAGPTLVIFRDCPASAKNSNYNPKNLGRSYGNNAKVVPDPNIPIRGFSGAQQSGHAVNQIINRGVTPQSLLDTEENPIAVIEQKVSGTTRYVFVGNTSTYTITTSGQVVTAWPSSLNKPFIQNIIRDAQ